MQVELPLAAPVIMAGVRTAAVWMIGTATLSTPVGQTSLGNYIFTGLQTENWVFVLFGCVAAAALALVVDRLLALVESGLRQRSRARLIASPARLAAGRRGEPRSAVGSARAPVIDRHQELRRAVHSGRADRRPAASRRDSTTGAATGSARRYFHALAAGEVDVYVDYSGTIWAN